MLTVLFDKNGFQDLVFDDCHGCDTEEVIFFNAWVRFLNAHHPFFNWISLALPFPHLNQAVTAVQRRV